MKGGDFVRVLWICVTLLILVYNVDTTEAVNWEVGSRYAMLSYTNRAEPFEASLIVQSQSRARFYFGFPLSDAVIVLPSFSLVGIGEDFTGEVSFQLQHHAHGYATSGVFVLGLVDVSFSSHDSVSPGGAVGIGVGYQQRLESSFVFRIGTMMAVVSSQSDSRGSSSPFDVNAFESRIYTSLGYTFNMFD